MNPRTENVRGGSRGCVSGFHHSQGATRTKAKGRHLLTSGTVRLVDTEMAFIPKEDNSFIHGFSKRQYEARYHDWDQTARNVEVSGGNGNPIL